MTRRGRRGLLAAGAVVAGLAAVTASAQTPPPEPSGYRMDDYRSATPATLAGARVLSTAEAHALWLAKDAVFVDALPQPPRPAGLPPGTIWNPKPRSDIPGSVWLPDTGYGALPPLMQDYFARGLEQASGGARDRTLVFYCLAGCWHSWNAAKRALSLGYTQVAWFPDGTDGWAEAKLPLEARQPAPRPDVSLPSIGNRP